jgi:hypothetical protein
MTVWDVPKQVAGSLHRFKYSLFYGYPGHRIVGYDNVRGERGKGDHRHLGDKEESYRFLSVEAPMADFLADVRRARGES